MLPEVDCAGNTKGKLSGRAAARPYRMASAPEGDLLPSRRSNGFAVGSHTFLRSAPAILPSVPRLYYTQLESRSWPVLMADMPTSAISKGFMPKPRMIIKPVLSRDVNIRRCSAAIIEAPQRGSLAPGSPSTTSVRWSSAATEAEPPDRIDEDHIIRRRKAPPERLPV